MYVVQVHAYIHCWVGSMGDADDALFITVAVIIGFLSVLMGLTGCCGCCFGMCYRACWPGLRRNACPAHKLKDLTNVELELVEKRGQLDAYPKVAEDIAISNLEEGLAKAPAVETIQRVTGYEGLSCVLLSLYRCMQLSNQHIGSNFESALYIAVEFAHQR